MYSSDNSDVPEDYLELAVVSLVTDILRPLSLSGKDGDCLDDLSIWLNCDCCGRYSHCANTIPFLR